MPLQQQRQSTRHTIGSKIQKTIPECTKRIVFDETYFSVICFTIITVLIIEINKSKRTFKLGRPLTATKTKNNVNPK